MRNHDALENFIDSSLAVINMAGRFPKARNLEEFWQNLRDGTEAISFFSDEEALAAGIDPKVISNPNYVKARGKLDDIELFDAQFFGFTPREAEITDPQHRLFMECVWEALEGAGYDPTRYKKRIGVFAGQSSNSYWFNLYSNPEILQEIGAFQAILANDKDHLTTRVSYKLDLRGPSVNVQTACSTSLVAVHIACQSLLNDECDMALAGGVSVGCSQNAGYFYQEGGISSPDGHCRAFDAKALGTVGGNGVCVLLLKRLGDALADRDNIDAVIRGSAINNDGASKVGYTAPSISGQADAILEAMAMAGVRPETISYIECHGTGTPIGDPIEIAALTQAFRTSTTRKGFCWIGSVKSNIGHLDAAAGAAGLIKTVLSLKHKRIPPSLHFQEPNPRIDFANSPFLVNNQLREWPSFTGPRRVGVSSFGMGGTNAHVVLEEAPALEASEEAPDTDDSIHLLLLSARTDSALEAMRLNLAEHLRKNSGLKLSDAAYTLQLGRKAFDYRQIFVCSDMDDAVRKLQQSKTAPANLLHHEGKMPSIVFLFPGQGTQYVNMGSGLYKRGGIFREQVDQCARLLEPELGLDIRDVLFPGEGREGDEQEAELRLRQTSITQPALFVIEYSLAKMWIDWGVKPQAMIGHSVGEYVAACLSGVLSLESALALVARRARLMQQQPTGAMLAVGLSEQEAANIPGDELSLAAANAPSLSVISGPIEAIERAESYCRENGVSCRRLQTSHAFHSWLMEEAASGFVDELRDVKLSSPQIPYLSNVTGTWITDDQATDPAYWAEHIRKPVRFSDGIQNILLEKEAVLLEVGPGNTLITLARRHAGSNPIRGMIGSMRRHDEGAPDEEVLLTALGKLWIAGGEIDWENYHAATSRRRVPLPTYPFERQRYWIDVKADAKAADRTRNRSHAKLKKEGDLNKWFYVPTWVRRPLESLSEQDGKEGQCWVVVSDRLGFANRFVKELEQTGRIVWLLEPGLHFERSADHAYTINPRQRSDYERVLADISSAKQNIEKIIHFGGVTDTHRESADVEDFYRYQQEGLYSLLSLAQALGIQNVTYPLEIITVTNNVQEVIGDERLQPEKATLLSACKVIPQEYLNITCRSIDIGLPEPGSKQEKALLKDLLAEVMAKASAGIVSYRRNHRWVQSVEQVSVGGKTEIGLRDRGVYLITGGLGRIGLACADYLAREAHAKLVLIRRTPFPRREDWRQWILDNGEQDEESQRIRLLESLERMGAEVVIENADAADYDQMQGVIGRLLDRFGQLNGVIHAAGVAGNKTLSAIQETTERECERHFRPKVEGVYTLEKVLEGIDIDFCMLFSSLSTMLGGLGFFAYCAANLFMDQYAVYKAQESSKPWISVDWDGWRFAKAEEETDDLGILPEEGTAVLSRILGMRRTPQVIISSADLQARISKWINPDRARETDARKAVSSNLHARPALKNEYQAPASQLEKTVVTVWQNLLGIEEIGVHDSFFELGGDSLMATQLVSRLRETFPVTISLRDVFFSPTVSNIALLILQKQAEQIDSDTVTSLLMELEQQSVGK